MIFPIHLSHCAKDNHHKRRLVVLDENIRNAMSQIGVQFSSRFDALTVLLDLTKGYPSTKVKH
ncbi:MAG: hypothetical protein VB134_01645 [[Clostridium] symbiosum]|nr:hypothetical protein [[Clostridium] symbiosum]